MRKILRFFLRKDDQDKVDPDTIQVEIGTSDFPDGAVLKMRVLNPNDRLSLVPITTGKLHFFPEYSAPGSKPSIPSGSPDINHWIDQNYDSWRTIGTIFVDLDPLNEKDKKSARDLKSALDSLYFNRSWYWPVRISKDFIKTTLLQHNKVDLMNESGMDRIKVPAKNDEDSSMWPHHVVKAFLRGQYGLTFGIHPNEPNEDDAVKWTFPELLIDPDGYTELWIALAKKIDKVDDRNDDLLGDLADSLPELDALRNLKIDLWHHVVHPLNATVPVLQTLGKVHDKLIDGDPGNPIADTILRSQRTTHQIHFTMPGDTETTYSMGLLPGHRLTITDQYGAVHQERRLPITGHLHLDISELTLPIDLNLALSPGVLKITALNGTHVIDTDHITVKLSQPSESTRIVVQPRWPELTSDEQGKRLSKICRNFIRHEATKKTVTKVLAAWEGRIRPADSSWNTVPNVPIFRGSLKPHTTTDERSLQALFKGLHRLQFTEQNPPLIRPAEAMVLWTMEGKHSIDMLYRYIHKNGPFPLKALDSSNIPEGYKFTDDDIENAKPFQIRELVRVILCWNYWGLDIMNYHAGTADNAPLLSGILADAMKKHNSHLDNRGLEAIKTEGVIPPLRETVTNTIRVNQDSNSKQWKVSLSPEHAEIMIWLQYAEYLRRQKRLKTAVGLTGVSAKFAESPAFRYMAFNGGFEQDLVQNGWDEFNKTWFMFTTPEPPSHPVPNKTWKKRLIWTWWDFVKTEQAANPIMVDKSVEEILLSKPLTILEIKQTPLTPLTNLPRSTAVRVNGLHFAALVQTYGGVFPTVL